MRFNREAKTDQGLLTSAHEDIARFVAWHYRPALDVDDSGARVVRVLSGARADARHPLVSLDHYLEPTIDPAAPHEERVGRGRVDIRYLLADTSPDVASRLSLRLPHVRPAPTSPVEVVSVNRPEVTELIPHVQVAGGTGTFAPILKNSDWLANDVPVLHVRLHPGSRIVLPWPRLASAFAYSLSGGGFIGPDFYGLKPGAVGVFGTSGSSILLEAHPTAAHRWWPKPRARSHEEASVGWDVLLFGARRAPVGSR